MSNARSFAKCANPACVYQRDVDRWNGHIHYHCCSVCKRWRETGNVFTAHDHHRYCKRIPWQEGQPMPSDVATGRHARSRSPRGPEGYATRSRHHCMVVTLGFRGGEGRALLQTNPGIEQHIVNVTELSDHQGGGPDGTNQRTQARVRCTPGFDSLLHRVLGIILTEPLIIIACNHGRHRSVAMAEIAAERIRDLRAPTLTLDVVHIDLGLFTPDQFRRLQLWS